MEGCTVTQASVSGLRWDLLEATLASSTGLNARLAVPNQSAEVYIAIDTSNRRYILVRIPEGETALLSGRITHGIAVQTVELSIDCQGTNAAFIEIACLDRAGYAALDTVTIELVNAITSGASISRVRLVQAVLSKWRRFWSGITNAGLAREEQVGLFGEIWFLRHWLLPIVGNSAVETWRGPIGARNDFETAGYAVEVKTSSRVDGGHVIHGLEQLLAPPDVRLFLFSLLVRDEGTGVESLPKLIDEVRQIIADDALVLTQFEGILAAAGYDDVHAPDYSKTKYRIRTQALYQVDPGFPRLIPSSLSDGVPLGISKVTYEVQLDAATHWLVTDTPVQFFP